MTLIPCALSITLSGYSPRTASPNPSFPHSHAAIGKKSERTVFPLPTPTPPPQCHPVLPIDINLYVPSNPTVSRPMLFKMDEEDLCL